MNFDECVREREGERKRGREVERKRGREKERERGRGCFLGSGLLDVNFLRTEQRVNINHQNYQTNNHIPI